MVAVATRSGEERRANAFDLLRLLGALAVLVEHSWVLAGHGLPLLPAESGTTLGRIGVGIFFLTSGYLITSSWLADPSVGRFLARRALRIYPLFAVVVLMLALVAGPLLTVLPVGEYYTHPQTWTYLGNNLLVFPTEFALPGVFAGAPGSEAVNGSLWTIPTEILCYFAVIALGVAGIVRRRWLMGLAALVPVAACAAVLVSGYSGTVVPRLLDARSVEQVALFAVGMVALHLLRRRGPGLPVAVLAILVWLVSWGTPLAPLAALVAVAVVTLSVAFRAPARLRHPTGSYDLSYGTYLFAFPVQQVLVAAGIRDGGLVLGLTIAIVLPLAALSWRWLERPALRLKPRGAHPRGRTEPALAASRAASARRDEA